MNIRFPTISIFSAACLLAACSGGGGSSSLPASSGSSDAPPTITDGAPATVTVTAPASVIVGHSFDISWTSIGATTCSPDFDNHTLGNKTATVEKIETALGPKTYSVKCLGSGGYVTSSATVDIVEGATAAGIWNGTTTDDRAVTGVVTHADANTQISKFFLVYSQAGNHAVPAGFVIGGGTSTSTSDTDGNYASASATNALREFNFEGNGAGGGSLQATYSERNTFAGSFQSVPLSIASSLSGHMTAFDNAAFNTNTVLITFAPSISAQPPSATFDPLAVLNNPNAYVNALTFSDGGTPWTIDVSGSTPQFSGKIVYDPYDERVWFDYPLYGGSNSYGDIDYHLKPHVIEFDPVTKARDSQGHLVNVNNAVTYNASTRTLTWTGTTSIDAAAGTLSVGTFTTTDQVDGQDFTCLGNGAGQAPGLVCPAFPPLGVTGTVSLVFDDASLTTFTGTVDWYQGASPPFPRATMAFTGATVPASAKVTQSYQATYNAVYELTPSLTDLQGVYTGTTGIDVATGAGTFDVAADGSINGASAGCTYTGTANPETIGNVYDITLSFSGGACAYSGPFTGIATYDAGANQMTLTAVNAARDKGFMFVGVKP